MTIKQVLEAIGIPVNTEIATNTPTPQPKSEDPKPENPKSENPKPENPKPENPKPENDSSINEQSQIAELQKQLDDLKAVNARLLAQTPVVEKPQTAQDALLELLGIERGENDNG